MLRLSILIALVLGTITGFAAPALPLTGEDVVVITGGTEMVEIQKSGHLEALLSLHYAKSIPTFRDLAWEADTVSFQGTVDGQWRTKGHFEDIQAFGNWHAQLKKVGATVIVAQYGANEFLQGQEIVGFREDLNELLETFSKTTERIILVSPAPFEDELARHNKSLLNYVSVMRESAELRDFTFIDLSSAPIPNRTRNGWLTAPNHHAAMADQIAVQLGISTPADWSALEPLRQSIIEKHRLWTDYWRPANWKCLFGDDGKRTFAKASENQPSFQEEWATFPTLIAKAEKQVAAIANGNLHAKEWAPLHHKPRTGSAEANIATELAAFTPPEGYRVNLFADESLGIANPLAIRWDPQGRLYVACTYVYPQIDPGAMPDDTIIILEDTNQDGRADKSTVFAEGLNIPTGMELGDGGVYVGQNTQLLFLKDTDGDSVADQRTVVLSGFGNGDSHQTSNGFVWSPGGELFFCQGDGIESRVETPHGVSGLYGPGAFRFRPGRMQLDGMLNNFMGPGNPWGIAFDDWGQAIIIDGAGGISHLTPAFLPVKRKLRLPRIGDPGGYCGIDILASDKFPEDWRHDFVIGDYKRNQITRFSTEPDGAGFKVKFESPLLTSSHRNFRPVDVRVGPDGGVYVADFYNPIICHQDDFYRISTRDKTHGRVWRLAPTGQKFNVPAITGPESLTSPDRWTRYQAKRVLTSGDHNELEQWALSQTDHVAKLEALRLLETIEKPNQELLAKCLASTEPRLRAYATRVLGRWADRLNNPLELLKPRLVDEDIRVRLEAALSCGSIQKAGSIHALLTLTDQPMDKWVSYAFKQAVESLKPTWMPRFKSGQLSFSNPKHLAAIFEATNSKDLLAIEREIVVDERLSVSIRLERLLALVTHGAESDVRFAFRPEFVTRALPKIATMIREGVIEHEAPDDADALIRPWLEHSDPSTNLAAIEIAGAWKQASVAETLTELANRSELRATSIAALGRIGGKEATQFLSELSDPDQGAMTRSQAVAALTEIDLDRAAPLAASVLSQTDSLESHPQAIEIIAQAFSSSPQKSNALLATLEGKTVAVGTARKAFQSLQFVPSDQVMALRNYFGNHLGITPEISQYDHDFVISLKHEVESKGDPDKGEDVFRSPGTNCYTCHKINDAGGTIGPDLTAIGNAVPIERLITEVVWPQRMIKEGYNLFQVTQQDGNVVVGYQDKNQDQNSIYIRDPSTHHVRRIPREKIKDMKDLGSAMLPGLTAALKREELRDLISFLKELGPGTQGDPRIITAWEVAVGDAWLPFQSRVSGELRATDLAFYATGGSVTIRTADGGRIEGHDGAQLKLQLDATDEGLVLMREQD